MPLGLDSSILTGSAIGGVGGVRASAQPARGLLGRVARLSCVVCAEGCGSPPLRSLLVFC
jgi:hypothetical protein